MKKKRNIAGENNPFYGKKHTKETKRKIGLKSKGRCLGEKSPLWKKDRPDHTRSLKYKENVAGRKRPDRCEICGAIGIMYFDHDHKTGEFRGWICNRCNRVLGFVKDDKELLGELINYLN